MIMLPYFKMGCRAISDHVSAKLFDGSGASMPGIGVDVLMVASYSKIVLAPQTHISSLAYSRVGTLMCDTSWWAYSLVW